MNIVAPLLRLLLTYLEQEYVDYSAQNRSSSVIDESILRPFGFEIFVPRKAFVVLEKLFLIS